MGALSLTSMTVTVTLADDTRTGVPPSVARRLKLNEVSVSRSITLFTAITPEAEVTYSNQRRGRRSVTAWEMKVIDSLCST